MHSRVPSLSLSLSCFSFYKCLCQRLTFNSLQWGNCSAMYKILSNNQVIFNWFSIMFLANEPLLHAFLLRWQAESIHSLSVRNLKNPSFVFRRHCGQRWAFLWLPGFFPPFKSLFNLTWEKKTFKNVRQPPLSWFWPLPLMFYWDFLKVKTAMLYFSTPPQMCMSPYIATKAYWT